MQPLIDGTAVRRARDLTAAGGDQFLPVMEGLRPLLPAGGLRRGSTIGIDTTGSGATSVMLALLSAASQTGSWCAIAGIPQLGYVAAAELGVALQRLAIVPDPGRDWPTVIATLIDGFDLVVARIHQPVTETIAGRLAAHTRQRGTVLIPVGTRWPGTATTIRVAEAEWHGLGEGASRRLTLTATGRGAATISTRTQIWLPAPTRDDIPAGHDDTEPLCSPLRLISRPEDS